MHSSPTWHSVEIKQVSGRIQRDDRVGREVVAFYSHKPESYPAGSQHLHCFSNFSPHPVLINGVAYKTSEHRFQAAKATTPARAVEITLAPTPMDAARMGRDRGHPLREDWEQVKEQIMLDTLRAKFTQNDCCCEALLGTGDAYLEERTKNDGYWGSGTDEAGGTGKNRLGYLLMQVRDELRAKQ
jgi:N-glycosidase YbiA